MMDAFSGVFFFVCVWMPSIPSRRLRGAQAFALQAFFFGDGVTKRMHSAVLRL